MEDLFAKFFAMNPEEQFQNRLAKLNPGQREAVETIEGPVMVIAGPGTGKTEVLAMRIAALLRSEAQVSPSEVLCLTYTDDASQSMRNRLLDIIGIEANQVQIHTFHAFCNQVIQQNREYFSYGELTPAEELDRIEIVYEILHELPEGHKLRRLGSNPYSDIYRLLHLFSMMKEEHITVSMLHEAIDQEIEELPNREEMIYQRNTKRNKKGDLKVEELAKQVDKLETTRAAAELLDTFQEKMAARGLYDFSDMILWVIQAFEQHPELLMQYQEKCQYILVDEFQDTNGAQNEVLKQLLSYWDVPNVFVVGDDDQSVFEFQGARIENIVEFQRRYKDSIRMILLTENYRSSPPILEWAAKAIEHNQSRLIKQLPELGLDKAIRSAHPRFADPDSCPQPRVVEYSALAMEEADLVLKIEALLRQKVSPRDIAVIYAQHKQADRILDLMDKRGIPYFVKRPAHLLDIPLVKQLLNLFEYLKQELDQPFSGEPMLYQLLHSPFLQVPPGDIARIALYKLLRNKGRNVPDPRMETWRTCISDKLNLISLDLENPEALIRIGTNLDNWLQAVGMLPLPALMEKIVQESGIMGYILSEKDRLYQLEVLQSFYDFVLDQVEKNPGISLEGFLDRVDKHRSMKLRIPVQRIFSQRDGVQFFTAHASKGNEFEYVFLIGLTNNFWEAKRAGNTRFTIPSRLSLSSDHQGSGPIEVARRLFYVAITRAKKHLQISYTQDLSGTGKKAQRSVFVDEVCDPMDREKGEVEEEAMLEYLETALQPRQGPQIELAHGRYIEEALSKFRMSTTALSLYLRCPLSFYYERVLRVPRVENDALVYGIAVHVALKFMVERRSAHHGEFPPLDEVLGRFYLELGRRKRALTPDQYERRREKGTLEISEYYKEVQGHIPAKVEVEKSFHLKWKGEIPLTGEIDRLDFYEGYCRIIDYKTGNPEKKNIKPPDPEREELGSDLWRQMAFYKLLVENSPESYPEVQGGQFEFLQRNKDGSYHRPQANLTAEDVRSLGEQVETAYRQIMNQEFDRGCGKDGCTWCQFVHTYGLNKEVAKD